MFGKRFRKAPWYPTAAALCVAVTLYVLLTRFPGIWASFREFLGHFRPVVIGCVIAYIVNPLSGLFERLFRGIKKKNVRRALSTSLAFILVVLFLVFALLILIPQIVESIRTFVANLDGYIASIKRMLDRWGLSQNMFGLDSVISSTENLLSSVSDYVSGNIRTILSTSANVGRSLFRWLIAFFLSIYLLTEKTRLEAGVSRLLRALFGEERYTEVHAFLHKCNAICSRYIVANLTDSLIVGIANMLFMTVLGMQYVGLISFCAAVSNLVPTFGPMVGAVIGAFILLMVNPIHALIFIIFTLVLQTCDAYIIKPRLFGSSLGVSGLLILVGVIVGGNIFGVTGILLAVPAVAILDYAYSTLFLPWLENRHAKPPEDAEKKE